MPDLDFKGKPFVYAHHLSVPFRELVIDPKKSLPGPNGPSLDDNLIIHGDNLEALKALLPRYAGKVDVIYIDPPYNTGNEGWAYNDNVNAPLLKQWFGKVVDADDLEKHDKWLSMMWPRLNLLHELLSERGVLFISINSIEKAVCLASLFGSHAKTKTIETRAAFLKITSTSLSSVPSSRESAGKLRGGRTRTTTLAASGKAGTW